MPHATSRPSQAPPKGVWSAEGNATRALSEEDETVASGLRVFVPTHSFRRDVLAYCELRNLVPHPKLLPLHADEEEAQGADESTASSSSANVYDLSDVDQVTIRNWQLDDGNCRALCFALPHATRLRSLCLFSAGLSRDQLALVSRAVPHSYIQSLQLDWNPVDAAPSEPSGTSSSDKEPNEPGDDSEIDDCVFAEVLGDGSRLVFLSLRANGITSRGAAAIAQSLRSNSTLEALNLFDNRLGDAGALEIAHALPSNTTLRTLSLANNDISGQGFRALAEAVTKYEAPQELRDQLHAAESRIQAQIDQAKRAKKKMDRHAAIVALSLPILEHDAASDRWLAQGNTTLQELVLSGNAGIEERDVRDASALLDAHGDKLRGHLRRIKLQRLALPASSCEPPFSEFLVV